MTNYDPYQREYSRRHVREEQRRDDRYLEDRYLDARDYVPKPYPSRDLVPRAREDSDLSIEEIRRDFPPPSARDARRARSAEPGYYEANYDYYRRSGPDARYDRDRDRDLDRHDRRSDRGGPSSLYYQDEYHKRSPTSKSMAKQDKIIAAVAGAALLVGGKELYDRHEAKTEGIDVQRNPLSSAALAGFGALAGYQGAEFYSKQQSQKDQTATYILQRGRGGHVSEYYLDQEDAPVEKKSHRSFLENAIAATGLGAAVKSLTGGVDDRRSDTRSRRGDSPSDSRAPSGANKIQKAAMASLLAGATEAFRVSKEPGSWKGEKSKRVLTAAAGAATVDAAQGDGHNRLGLAESVIGGLLGNRLINGSKKDIEEDKLTGRSRSRSRARSRSHGTSSAGGGGGPSGLAALATAGLGALGAKRVLDRSRSRSRGRNYDTRSPSPDRRRQRSRSRSVVDKARNSLAKLGIGSGAAADDAGEHRRRDQDDFDDNVSARRSRRYSDDMDEEDRYSRARGGYEPQRPRRRADDSPRRLQPVRLRDGI